MRALAIDQRMARLGFGLRSIPGLEAAWLSRFPSGLGTMALPADGTAMGTWVDLSGKGRDLTQATGANQPLWRRAGVNLLPVPAGSMSTDPEPPTYQSSYVWQNSTLGTGPAKSLKITATTTAVATLLSRANDTWSRVAVTVGQVITARATLKSSSGRRVRLNFTFYNDDAVAIGGVIYGAGPATDGTVQTRYVSATVPAGATRVHLWLEFYDGASPQIGDELEVSAFQLELSPIATPWLPPGNAMGMQFDGVDDFMATLPLAGWPETTVYAVVTTLSLGVQRYFLSHMNLSGTDRTGWGMAWDGNSRYFAEVFTSPSGSVLLKPGAAETVSLPHVISARMTLTDFSASDNGVPGSATAAFVPVAGKSIYVGKEPSLAAPTVLIHDLIICSQAHDDTTRKRVEAALARANGVTLAA